MMDGADQADATFMDEYLLVSGGAWIALQALALCQLQGWWRNAAWLSAAVMGLAIIVATLGVLAGSDIAPIWVVLALPICLAWVVLLWVARGVAWLFMR
jgi:hypothetical protein